MIYAEVIGDPIAHSKSPAIHNFWLRALGVEASYKRARVPARELRMHLERRRSDPRWRGCNVTMPLKEIALHEVDSLCPSARACMAVNCISRYEGGLVGSNFDGAGFLDSILPFGTQAIGRALIIGSGGAARGLAHGLHSIGLRLDFLARDLAKAGMLLAGTGIEAQAFPLSGGLPKLLEPAIVVNATPLGMSGYPGLHLALGDLPEGSIVADIVTSPADTLFLRTAAASGFRTVTGVHMLICQAARSFRAIFGIQAPRALDSILIDKLA